MIYIDDFNASFGRMTMCHMIADSTEELLLMADKIGVQRKWIQDAGTQREHFDICLSKKKKAIECGAKEIGMRELASMTSKRDAPPAKLNKAFVMLSLLRAKNKHKMKVNDKEVQLAYSLLSDVSEGTKRGRELELQGILKGMLIKNGNKKEDVQKVKIICSGGRFEFARNNGA